jgi:thiol-disulfide isomerase/thioredoxin
MANARLNLPTRWLIAAAIVAGIVAGGALGLYVMDSPSGNNGQQAALASADDSTCSAKQDLAATAGAAAKGEVAAMLAASPPLSLKTLAFNAPDGTPMTMAGLSGKTVLLNLWATWCAPCRHEMPALNQLQAEEGGADFEVVAINVDTGTDEKPKRFLEETQVDALGYYRDATMGVFNELKRRGLALGLPVTVLIDGDGCMLAHMNGPAEWASADAKALIASVR